MSFAESLYAEQRSRSRPSRSARARTASTLAGPCSSDPPPGGGPAGPALGRPGRRRPHGGAGVDPAAVLGAGPDPAGQPEPAGDDLRDLDRGGRHEPDPLARVEVHLREGTGARPDLV